MDLEYAWFKKKINELAGIDLDGYRQEQMRRLLDKMLDQHGIRNYVEFIKYLKESPERLQEFRDGMTINVSSLFRDYPRWMELRPLLEGMAAAHTGKQDQPLKCWSAGCSIGAEPYTLAMLLLEIVSQPGAPKFDFEILCTDIDHVVLRRAEDGIFTDKEAGETPRRLLKKYFDEIPSPRTEWAGKSMASVFYSARTELKSHMRFRQHNMLEDKFEENLDLVICRNVIIYFTAEKKKRLIERFCGALNKDGHLFLGGTEVIFTPAQFGLESVATGIYKKPAV